MAQRFGALGPGSIEAVIDHARVFVTALEGVRGTVLDLGSGGGVPGLVIATDRTDLSVVLVDRRQGRTDLCERLVARLGMEDRVRVVHADVRDLAVDGAIAPVDAVVARGFGEPSSTLRHAARLVRAGGTIVISEPPTGDRWDPELLELAGVSRQGWVEVPVGEQAEVGARAVVFERST